jgi:hypothetical protein
VKRKPKTARPFKKGRKERPASHRSFYAVSLLDVTD